MAKVDLHLHSTASDGLLNPVDVVCKSAAVGLTVIAIADHDTVEGIAPALETALAFPWLKVIPCVEISTDVPGGEVHLLGYFIDYTDPELKTSLNSMRNSRWERARKMVSKLRNLGLHIAWDRVQEIAGDSTLGRPHIARAMLEKGYINSFRQAFTRYIGRGGPAYVEREKMTPVEAAELILRSDGLPVLAHPLTAPDPEAMLIQLNDVGLVGIEAYYKNYTVEETDWLVSLANKYHLIASGGSDYHGHDDDTETMIGGVDVPLQSAERLIALAKERALKLPNPSG